MAEIKLSNGLSSIVDDQFYDHLNQFTWHCLDGDTLVTKYAYCWNSYPSALMMHRLIMDAKSGFVVDHINHNGLDNRKQNLRVVSYSAHNSNRDGVKGYHWDTVRHKWKAMISINGYAYFLGRFDSEEEAALVYDRAKRYFYPELFVGSE